MISKLTTKNSKLLCESLFPLWQKQAQNGNVLDNFGVVWAHFGVLLDKFGNVWDYFCNSNTPINRIFNNKNAENTIFLSNFIKKKAGTSPALK